LFKLNFRVLTWRLILRKRIEEIVVKHAMFFSSHVGSFLLFMFLFPLVLFESPLQKSHYKLVLFFWQLSSQNRRSDTSFDSKSWIRFWKRSEIIFFALLLRVVVSILWLVLMLFLSLKLGFLTAFSLTMVLLALGFMTLVPSSLCMLLL
jgi:hypothetical protein